MTTSGEVPEFGNDMVHRFYSGSQQPSRGFKRVRGDFDSTRSRRSGIAHEVARTKK
eukprot:CAMPEP_0175443556 /NCGR_PEP_ID=MMETSP0095-20121207/58741_1 /TAXON_ID=311494 /ORGANISM="Alexandrium monilatum, Strain CCMP3105" /LENGTH=55 /DNA_ID=CAMNT_0016743653 /DNA_START=67 /DNA_END=231 /DNA_ORIENTATION=-